MEWSNETVLNFIHDYRSNPSLWDTKVADYKNMVLKKSVLRSLAKKYECDVGHIKRKIKSLRTAFRREVTKVRHRRSIDSSSDLTSKWFAYRPLSFLLEDESLKLEVDGEVDDEVEVEETHENFNSSTLRDVHEESSQLYRSNFDETPTETNDISEPVDYCTTSEPANNQQSSVSVHIPKRPKLKRPTQNSIKPINLDRSIIDAYKLFRPQNNSQAKDEFDYFGRNISARIRKLKTDKAKSCVQHLVSNIIFEAEMGKYDNGLPVNSEVNGGGNVNENRLSDAPSQGYEQQNLHHDEPFIKVEL